MSLTDFEVFKAELTAIKNSVWAIKLRTVRDEQLLDRIRILFRTWTAVVHPYIAPFLQEKREFLKLNSELEVLAKLTSKTKPVAEYRKHLNKAIELANNIILYLPPSKIELLPHTTNREKLFISEIPDLLTRLVPNSLLGWRSHLEAFVNKYPFDQSVFIMIRYRNRNKNLIKSIKDTLKKHNLYGVLASEHRLTDDLYNAIACLFCCSKGIAIFDKAEANQTFNPNVAYELGMMHLLDRELLILKHNSLRVLHTDILMKLYQEYGTVTQVEGYINGWLANTGNRRVLG